MFEEEDLKLKFVVEGVLVPKIWSLGLRVGILLSWSLW